MQTQYPANGLWTLIAGSLKIRTGHAEEGETLYREVLDQDRGKQTVTGKALYDAAQKALKLRHPDQRIE